MDSKELFHNETDTGAEMQAPQQKLEPQAEPVPELEQQPVSAGPEAPAPVSAAPEPAGPEANPPEASEPPRPAPETQQTVRPAQSAWQSAGAYHFGPGSVYAAQTDPSHFYQPNRQVSPGAWQAGPYAGWQPNAWQPGQTAAGAYARPTAQGWQGYGQAAQPGQTAQTARPEPNPRPEQTSAPGGQSTAVPAKKHRSRGWLVALVLAGAILVGVAGGAGGYHLLTRRANAGTLPAETTAELPAEEEAAEPTRGSGDITQRITSGTSQDYAAPAKIYQENVDAVVGISTEGTATNIWGQPTSFAASGTGFILSEDGYVLTNYHVVKDGTTLTVSTSDGTKYPAQLVGYENVTCDVALLKIDASGLPTVKVGDSDQLQVGEQVCTIGNPLGELTYTLTVGYVSAKQRAINTDGSPINMLQTDAAINSGNSGGPLFDAAGNVVGIVTAKYSGETTSGASMEGLGFAIPINDVMAILDDLEQYGYVTNRAYLGVQVGDSAAVQGANLPAGAYIGQVVDGFCAQKAGIQQGDVIVGLGDTVISSYEELVTALQHYKAGDTTTVTVFRSGQYLDLEITFDARPKDLPQAQQPQQETTPPETEDPFGFMFP